MLEFVIYFIVTALVGVVTGLIIYGRRNYGELEKMKGIPVVKPYFLLGSYPNLHKLVVHDEDINNWKKHGSVWGVYEGAEPHIYITDPDVIRQIFIKDFDHFHDKRILDFGHPLINEMMDILPAEKWKVVRNFCSPAFTTGKIRVMSYQMVESITELFDHIKDTISTTDSQEFNVKKIFSCLTTDVVAKCAFGTKVSAIKDPENIFVKMVLRLTGDDDENINFLLAVVQTFPAIASMNPFIPPEVLNFFGKVLGDIMKGRRKSETKYNDFIDFLNEMVDSTATEKFQKLGITDTTVMAQALIFLFAGFDTTATTLTMFSYRMAQNQEKQKKLIKEIDEYLKRNNGKIEHETLGELVYLNACMNETLRMCPPLIRVERVCQKDWSYEPAGLNFKKGQVVQVPNFAVHNDPKNYPNPDQFQPERFLAENKDKLNQYAFMSFGQGPHNCIGMRFAQEEFKLTVATILKDFYFETCEKTKLKFKPGRTFLVQYEPVYLKITKRNK